MARARGLGCSASGTGARCVFSLREWPARLETLLEGGHQILGRGWRRGLGGFERSAGSLVLDGREDTLAILVRMLRQVCLGLREIIDQPDGELQLSRSDLRVRAFHLGEVGDLVGVVQRVEVQAVPDRTQEDQV